MIEYLDHFLFRALISGLLLALICGPLGSLVLWKRLSFFGDTLSHAALLGVAISLSMQWPLMFGVVCVTLVIAIGLIIFQNERQQSMSTTLSIISQGLLALGVVWLSFSSMRGSIMNILFGDLLALSRLDMLVLAIFAPLVLFIIRWLWKDILKVVINRDIAAAEGVRVQLVQVLVTVSLALCIAIASRLVGVLLITSLLVIPAATARFMSRSPERMIVWSSVLAVVSVFGGIGFSWWVDTPTCPAITLAALALYIVIFIERKCAIFYSARKKVVDTVS